MQLLPRSNEVIGAGISGDLIECLLNCAIEFQIILIVYSIQFTKVTF